MDWLGLYDFIPPFVVCGAMPYELGSPNVHESLECDKLDIKNSYLVCGPYEYYHYVCDGFDDRGWGCGYRTLQTISSWMKHNISTIKKIPTIKELQKILVQMQDKPESFIGSRQWIGSFEACLVIEYLYDVPSKMLHVNSGGDLSSIVEALRTHFNKFGSPIMMGGDVDCSSKGIMGINVSSSDAYLLVVDPHYVGKEQSKEFLQSKGWVKWQPLSDFLSSSFYNLCLPQIKSKYKV